jgi:hypothetical protein
VVSAYSPQQSYVHFLFSVLWVVVDPWLFLVAAQIKKYDDHSYLNRNMFSIWCIFRFQQNIGWVWCNYGVWGRRYMPIQHAIRSLYSGCPNQEVERPFLVIGLMIGTCYSYFDADSGI